MTTDVLQNNSNGGFSEISDSSTKEKNMVEITKYVNGKKTRVWVDLNEMDEMMRAAWQKKQKKKVVPPPPPPPEEKPENLSNNVNGAMPLVSKEEVVVKDNGDKKKKKERDSAQGESALDVQKSPRSRKKKLTSKKFHYSFPAQQRQEQEPESDRLSLSERDVDGSSDIPDAASSEFDDDKRNGTKMKIESKLSSSEEASPQSNGKKRRGSRKFHHTFPKKYHEPEMGRQSHSEREAEDSLSAFDELGPASKDHTYGVSLSALLDKSPKPTRKVLSSNEDSSVMEESVFSEESFFDKEAGKRASSGIIPIEDVPMKPQISSRIEEKMKDYKTKSTKKKTKKKSQSSQRKGSAKGSPKRTSKKSAMKLDGTKKLLDIGKKSDDLSKAHKKRMKEIEKKLAKIEQEKKDELKELKKENKAERSKVKREFHEAKVKESKRVQELQESGQQMIEYFQKENQNLLDQAVNLKHEMITLKKQKKLLEKRGSEMDDRYESLKRWVERKTKSKERREKLVNAAMTKYIPNHKEAIQLSNRHCVAEYRIREECQTTLERIVEAFKAEGTDPSLVREILQLEKQCNDELDDLPDVAIPKKLKSLL